MVLLHCYRQWQELTYCFSVRAYSVKKAKRHYHVNLLNSKFFFSIKFSKWVDTSFFFFQIFKSQTQMLLAAETFCCTFQWPIVPDNNFYITALLMLPYWCILVSTVSIFWPASAMTGFEQQRGRFHLVQVAAGVVITSWGCESFLRTTVSCAFHVVLTHPPLGTGHVGQSLTDMSNEHTVSGKHWAHLSPSVRCEAL